ncbi:MAG: hypothetical protein ACTHU0_21605 [Kofleriaceae bacterium]
MRNAGLGVSHLGVLVRRDASVEILWDATAFARGRWIAGLRQVTALTGGPIEPPPRSNAPAMTVIERALFEVEVAMTAAVQRLLPLPPARPSAERPAPAIPSATVTEAALVGMDPEALQRRRREMGARLTAIDGRLAVLTRLSRERGPAARSAARERAALVREKGTLTEEIHVIKAALAQHGQLVPRGVQFWELLRECHQVLSAIKLDDDDPLLTRVEDTMERIEAAIPLEFLLKDEESLRGEEP